jgi:S-formylglutathione hydrolase FrmB
MSFLSSAIINWLRRSSNCRTRSTTRPSRVEVESTSEPVAEIRRAGVIIAVKNSMVEFSTFGLTLIKSPAAIAQFGIFDSGFGIEIWNLKFVIYNFGNTFPDCRISARFIIKFNAMTTNKQTQGTVRVLRHESEILKNNPLGDKSVRDLIVYLPPNYEETDETFPVVYCLTGFTGRGKMFLNDNAFAPNLAERFDKLIGENRIKPMIAVMPDCFTYYGGSQYINSSATGNYEDYLTQEIVPFVDAQFRTVTDKNSRAVMGKSSGGYGALIMAMRHADIFGLACSTSGDCYFEFCYFPGIAEGFHSVNGNPKVLIEKFWLENARKSKHDFAALNTIGMSSCYSPNPESKLGFDLPFDLETGEIRAEIWARWLEHDPVRLVEKHAENLKSLKLLFIDAGTRDEFALDLGARILCKRLNKAGVSFVHEEFDDGHFNISYRQNRSLEMISNAIHS